MIGLDVRMWDHPGIGRYIRELVRAMKKEAPGERFCLLGYRRRRDEILDGAGNAFGFREVSSGIYSLSEQLEMAAKAKDFDLLHVPHFNIPLLFKGKLVVTVHDLIYLREPAASKKFLAQAYARFFFKAIAGKAAAVIAVSEYTKRDFLGMFPSVSPDRVSVTYEAASPVFRRMEKERLEEIRRRHGLNGPFVLFVGSLKPHKNVPALIRAVELLRNRNAFPVDLVLVGRKDARDGELFRTVKERRFVHYLGELKDEEVAALYNLAAVFVLPSFREGFGLPALEAMACGTPVIASNRASLPEVIGGAGMLFDPHEVDALAEALNKVLANKKLSEEMSQKGLERVKEFSWEKAARQTLQVYRKLKEEK
ncbi:MAG: glycosyltransferase family 4 protein [Candidatus Omnitrophica bacterium]|nr:glycosyltransferase family 4 protein [Candidatus Omnitrophota bacterium]